MAFVLDASITAFWALEDEDHPDAGDGSVNQIPPLSCLTSRGFECDWTGSREQMRFCGWRGPTGYLFTMPLIWNWRSGRAYLLRRLTRIFEGQRPRKE